MKKLFKNFSRFVLKIILLLLIMTTSWVLLYRYVNPPVTPLMVIRYLESDGQSRRILKTWKDYDSISVDMALAVIAAEDQKFFEHPGFDFNAIRGAAIDNIKEDRIKGASTITQQVAKNVFLWPKRSWLRKGAEAYFTILVETFWSKKRILEVYLNVVEMGDGIYGAERASQIYFNKPSSKLTKDEAALLAAILPSPRRMSPVNPSSYVNNRRQWIRDQMENIGNLRINTNDL
ncbi:MAG: monofunctional biosynthetic peptidoglycan transglycosylase [Deltaproteobacteria bacterium]|nr:monofunctional biosynthetic peptidoglycan transglycosylase [Deltaproteobacteria bacterium]